MATTNLRIVILSLGVTAILADFASAQTINSSRGSNPFYAMDTSFERPGLTTAQQLDLVKKLGYSGIAWHEQPPEQVRDTLAAVEKRGLKMFTIYCAAQINPQGEIRWSPQLPKLMETLDGHNTIIWLHLGGRGPAFEQLKADGPPVVQLRNLAEAASSHGLQVAIYPHFGEWTARFGGAVKLAKLVNHRRFGVTFNLCHALASGDEKEIPRLLEESKPVLTTVTICGADAGVRGANWGRLIRPLGRGTFDVRIVISALRKNDFGGPIGFQGYAIRGDADSILTPTMAAWRRLTAK
jgi:sugar phosphate isomerase/epimerase